MAQSDAEAALSPTDGADEKLLKSPEEVRVVSADMADVKYKVGDQRNGDINGVVDVNTNTRTFSGLTKEELLKYQDDPFWVRLRWVMFALFWLLWVGMLVGAILIIVNSPKCAPPRKWYERSPLLDLSGSPSFQDIMEDKLPLVEKSRVGAVIVPATLAGDIYDEGLDLGTFKRLVEAARAKSIKIVVDMAANYVNKSHPWFTRSERKEANYTDYFTWADGAADGQPPNHWNSTLGEPAWTLSDTRGAYYLHQYSADQPDLNFRNPRVVQHFADVIRKWINAGAAGIRLLNVRRLLASRDLNGEDVTMADSPGVSHLHNQTGDLQQLATILQQWRQEAYAIDSNSLVAAEEGAVVGEPFFTGSGNNWTSVVALPATGPVSAGETADRLYEHISTLLPFWPAVQVEGNGEKAREAAAASLLLPATPVLTWNQVYVLENNTWKVNPKFEELMSLRLTPAVFNSQHNLTNIGQQLLASIRWLKADDGLLALYNPTDTTVFAGNVSMLKWVPDTLVSMSENVIVKSNNVTVPAGYTALFKFVPVVEK